MTDERWKPAVTVAAVIEQGGRYLLVEEETPEGPMLNNPAGHLEAGESPQQAVVREALEEAAREFRPEFFLGAYLARVLRPATQEDVTYLRLAFGGSVGAQIAGRALDRGILRTLWLSPAEIAAARDAGRLRSPLVWRCLEDHLAGRRLPLDAVQADASLFAPEHRR
jgi:8-oxo-dGTP pyrophosphatase MutT (NUDIX family)